MDPISRQIEAAEGFALLGMDVDAWDALEALPARCRTWPAVLRVRLRICTASNRWEMGAEIAKVITPAYTEPVREAAGRFHLAQAQMFCALGDTKAARSAVTELAAVWPEGRTLVVESDALDAIW